MTSSSMPLSELVTLMRNGTTAEQNQDGVGYPVSRIETISDGTINSNRVRFVNFDEKNTTKWRVERGDILLSHINSEEHIGKSALYSGSPDVLIHGMNLLLLRPDINRVVPEYLHFALRSRAAREYIRARCKRAVNQASINQRELGTLKIPTPPLDEQRRVVDLLSRAESIIRLRREAQDKTAKVFPALFLEVIGDPATNPKGWPIVRISEIAHVGSGNGFPLANQGKATGSYPFYKVSDMNLPGNEVEMQDANNYISDDDLRALRATAYPPGTVVFPKIGAAIATNKKRVLTVAACFDNNVMGITPSAQLLSTYLYGLLQLKSISDFASDSNPPSIRKSTVEAWSVPLPPISTQEFFSLRVASDRAILRYQVSAMARAEIAFAALLGRAFASDLISRPFAPVENTFA